MNTSMPMVVTGKLLLNAAITPTMALIIPTINATHLSISVCLAITHLYYRQVGSIVSIP
jgi:hypothetical protein